MRLLNRREFNGLCVALGFCVASSGASAVQPASDAASSGASRTVKFPTGAVVPALGQGSWQSDAAQCPLMTQSGHSVPRIVAAQNDGRTPFRRSQIPAVIASYSA
jgi:hypothetical protein